MVELHAWQRSTATLSRMFRMFRMYRMYRTGRFDGELKCQAGYLNYGYLNYRSDTWRFTHWRTSHRSRWCALGLDP
jgi:hypothetical protein